MIERPGGSTDGIETLLERFPDAVGSGAVVAVDGPRVDFSASELRRTLATGQSVRYQIPDAVADYIKRQGTNCILTTYASPPGLAVIPT